MKYKWTEQEHNKLTQEIQDLAKKSIKEVLDNTLPWKNRFDSGKMGFSIYAFFGMVWIIRSYRWTRECLTVRFGVNIKVAILIMLGAWVVASVLTN